MPGIPLANSKRTPHQHKDPRRTRSMTRRTPAMKRIRIGRPGARSGRPRPRAPSPGPPDPGIVRATGARADRAVRNAGRAMMAWAGRRLWLVVRTVIRAIAMAHHEQVRMWECILETSGAAPLTAVGPLRWVQSLDGYRLAARPPPAPGPAA